MSGKPRVHELAKELGVPAKDVLLQLRDLGEFVKSASSTVERPVARRLREQFQAKVPTSGARGAAVTSPAPVNKLATGSQRLTPFQAASVCERFRQASASGHDQAAIEGIYSECEAQYGVSRATLRAVITDDLILHTREYVAKGKSCRGEGRAQPTADRSARAIMRVDLSRPRLRTKSVLPDVVVASTEQVADLIVDIRNTQDDQDVVMGWVRDFIPVDAVGCGYLAWRYSAAHRRAYLDGLSQTAHQDLALMAHVVDREKQLVDRIAHAHGPVLEQPDLAKRVLDAEFSDLIDVDDIGRSAADVFRHVRERLGFLRLAIVLVIASPECDQRLWGMLDQIRPPEPEQLVESSAELESAIGRLNELIADVETLLTFGEAPLSEFFQRAHSELTALHAGRYEFLREFSDIVPTGKSSRRANDGLPFVVLPRGEQLRRFLDGLRSSGSYRGHEVDEWRVAVLEDIERHFGADRCQWHEPAAVSGGFDNHYVVLSIKSANDSGEHAVAISPLAGEHATYVVRSDCAKENWMVVLAQSKPDAREQGARKFLFTGEDPYSGIRARVIEALECPLWSF